MSARDTGYTGEVEVDGPADVRQVPGLRITKVCTPPFTNNCYLLRCAATGDTLLVDAAGDAPRLLELLGNDRLVAVLQTHGHWDHQQALSEIVSATGAPVLVHRADAADLPVIADRLVEDGEVVTVGAISLRAVHLVGHTPGSLALVYSGDPQRAHVFSGDCLFPGGVGNTDQDPARFTSLLEGLQSKIFQVLPDQTWIYPGHGSDTTLGAERPNLPAWRQRGW